MNKKYEWLDCFPGPGSGWKPLRGVIVSKRESGVPGMQLAKVDLHDSEGIHDLVEVYIRERREWTIEENARVKFYSDGTYEVFVDDQWLAKGTFDHTWLNWLQASWPDVFAEDKNEK